MQQSKMVAPLLAAVAAAIIFIFAYWTNPVVPWPAGPAGWHTWADQTEYLRSTFAFSHLNFQPQNHNYPPLYALLAAPFSNLWPSDPFILLNLVCMCASAWLMVTIFQRELPPLIVLLATISMLGNSWIRDVFVIPFTSTLVAPLILASVALLQKAETSTKIPERQSFWFALCIGLAIPTRPLDGVIAGLLVPFWLWLLVLRFQSGQATMQSLKRHIAFLAVGGLIGPLILLTNNLFIFRSWKSGYLGLAKSLDLATVPQKFISVFLDSGSLYLDPGQAMLTRLPWVLPSIAGIILCILFGKLWQRAAAVIVIASFTLYLSFTDLLPNGLFRYSNYHYFRWPILLGSMLALVAIIPMFGAGTTTRRGIIVAVFIGVAALSGLHLNLTDRSIPVRQNGNLLTFEVGAIGTFDFLDLSPAKGEWAPSYFANPHGTLDGRELALMKEIKIIPSSIFPNDLGNGPGVNNIVRLLMLKRASGDLLTIQLDGLPFQFNAQPTARLGRFNYGWGIPRWLHAT